MNYEILPTPTYRYVHTHTHTVACVPASSVARTSSIDYTNTSSPPHTLPRRCMYVHTHTHTHTALCCFPPTPRCTLMVVSGACVCTHNTVASNFQLSLLSLLYVRIYVHVCLLTPTLCCVQFSSEVLSRNFHKSAIFILFIL